MSFWRDEVIGFALDQETRRHLEEQLAWIEREPTNAMPFYNLAQLYRIREKSDEALALLLEAVRLDADFADAHVALAEVYIVRDDASAAWRHARAAALLGKSSAAELLVRYGVKEPE
jgi:tetratricopeptide (TPR) repeat protein